MFLQIAKNGFYPDMRSGIFTLGIFSCILACAAILLDMPSYSQIFVIQAAFLMYSAAYCWLLYLISGIIESVIRIRSNFLRIGAMIGLFSAFLSGLFTVIYYSTGMSNSMTKARLWSGIVCLCGHLIMALIMAYYVTKVFTHQSSRSLPSRSILVKLIIQAILGLVAILAFDIANIMLDTQSNAGNVNLVLGCLIARGFSAVLGNVAILLVIYFVPPLPGMVVVMSTSGSSTDTTSSSFSISGTTSTMSQQTSNANANDNAAADRRTKFMPRPSMGANTYRSSVGSILSISDDLDINNIEHDEREGKEPERRPSDATTFVGNEQI